MRARLPVLVLVFAAACSQRVTPEEEYAGQERERPLMPVSAAPMEGAAPAPAGGAMAAPAGASDAAAIRVAVEGAPGVAGGAVLFVFVRPVGVTEGPPLAVRRIAAPELPLTLSIGPADAMIPGTTFPERVVVQGRLDLDGNVSTRSPLDWSGSSDPVEPGGEARIVLEPPAGP